MPGPEIAAVRFATWNVERPRPGGWKIPPLQRQRMADIGADVWVLTETHVGHGPGPEFEGVYSPPYPERRPETERWVGVFSRWPIVALEEPPAHRRGSVAARVETPLGSVIVYGTVIPWANERRYDNGDPARKWGVHLAEIERQGAEWRWLRDRYPGVPVVVAGDFNQDRDGSGHYSTRATRDNLSRQLAAAGLRCLTDLDVDAAGLLPGRHLIDHVCATADLRLAGVCCWGTHDDRGLRLSDHPTVAVDLTVAR